jgi:hypothetical protein
MNILTPDGYKSLEDCTSGDKVIAYDTLGNIESNSILSIQKVTKNLYGYADYTYEDDNGNSITEIGEDFAWYYIECDDGNSHLWFCDQSIWVIENNIQNIKHVKDLSIGDKIFNETDHILNITKITKLSQENCPEFWYRLSISGDSTFISDGIILHNASRYWSQTTGAGGIWTGTTYWSATSGGVGGATAPSTTGIDDVIFDTNSFNAVGACTISGVLSSRNLTIDKPLQGYINLTTTTSSIYGSVNVTDSACTFAQTGITTFKTSTSSVFTLLQGGTLLAIGGVRLSCGLATISTAGQSWPVGLTFTMTSGIGLANNLVCTGTTTTSIIFNSGIFSDNGFSITTNGGFSLGTNVVKTILKSGIWNYAVTATSSGTYWNAPATTSSINFIDTGSIVCNYNGSLASTFAGGSLTYNSLQFLTGTISTVARAITGNNTFNTLILNAAGNGNQLYTFAAGSVNTIGSFYALYSSGIIVKSTSTAVAYLYHIGNTLPCLAGGSQSVNYVSFSYISFMPSYTWYVGPNSTNVVGNVNGIFTNNPSTIIYPTSSESANSYDTIPEVSYPITFWTDDTSATSTDTFSENFTVWHTTQEAISQYYNPPVTSFAPYSPTVFYKNSDGYKQTIPSFYLYNITHPSDYTVVCTGMTLYAPYYNGTSVRLYARALSLTNAYYADILSYDSSFVDCFCNTVTQYTVVISLNRVVNGVITVLGSYTFITISPFDYAHYVDYFAIKVTGTLIEVKFQDTYHPLGTYIAVSNSSFSSGNSGIGMTHNAYVSYPTLFPVVPNFDMIPASLYNKDVTTNSIWDTLPYRMYDDISLTTAESTDTTITVEGIFSDIIVNSFDYQSVLSGIPVNENTSLLENYDGVNLVTFAEILLASDNQSNELQQPLSNNIAHFASNDIVATNTIGIFDTSIFTTLFDINSQSTTTLSNTFINTSVNTFSVSSNVNLNESSGNFVIGQFGISQDIGILGNNTNTTLNNIISENSLQISSLTSGSSTTTADMSSNYSGLLPLFTDFIVSNVGVYSNKTLNAITSIFSSGTILPVSGSVVLLDGLQMTVSTNNVYTSINSILNSTTSGITSGLMNYTKGFELRSLGANVNTPFVSLLKLNPDNKYYISSRARNTNHIAKSRKTIVDK